MSQRRSGVLIAAALALVVAWLTMRNLDAPLTARFGPDQANYLLTAFRFRSAGPSGLLREVGGSGIVGPLVPLLSQPFLALWPESAGAAMLVQPLLHVVTAAATGGVAATLSDRRTGLVAGVIALGVPEGLALASSYHLALGASASLSVAVLALLRSDRGLNRPMMVGFGAAVGALVLSRVVSAALVPGLLVGTAFYLRWSRRTVLNLALAAGAAAACASPWLWASRRPITDYVTGFGFEMGNPDVAGPSSPLIRFLLLLVSSLIYVRPLLVLPALVVCAVTAARLFARGRSGNLRAPLNDRTRGAIAVGLVVVLGFVTLAGTRNMGDVFTYPILVLAIAPIAAVGRRVGGVGVTTAGRVATAGALVNLMLVPMAYRFDHAVFEPEGAGEFLFGGADISEAPRAWERAMDDIIVAVEQVRSPSGATLQVVLDAGQEVNGNTVRLAESLAGFDVGAVIDSSAAELAALARDHDRVVVIALDGHDMSESGLRDPDTGTADALASGWTVHRRIALPDGSEAWVLTQADSQRPE